MKKWEPPAFVEVKMDAEIGAYQEDFKDVLEQASKPDEQLTVPPSQ